MLKTCWKYHKSKDLTFLHRSYINFFSIPKTNIFLIDRKKIIKSQNFQKTYFLRKIFFWSIEKIFFVGVEKKIGIQFRCKKVRSFDLWWFQNDLRHLESISGSCYFFFINLKHSIPPPGETAWPTVESIRPFYNIKAIALINSFDDSFDKSKLSDFNSFDKSKLFGRPQSATHSIATNEWWSSC